MPQSPPINEVKQIVLPLIMFSCVTNLAILVSPIFMMQVLDRVVPSGNLNTLLMLLLIALAAIALQSLIEMFRDISLARTARWIEAVCAQNIMQIATSERDAAIRSIRNLSTFLQSNQAVTALNIPWLPIFVLALGLIHPFFLLLVTSLVGMMCLVKGIASMLVSDTEAAIVSIKATEYQTLTDAHDPKIIAGMQAIATNLSKRFCDLQIERHKLQDNSAFVATLRTASLGFLRASAQLLGLSLGAYLVVRGDLTAGGMIGASIISAKTIITVEGCLNNLVGIRDSKAAMIYLNGLDMGKKFIPIEVESLSGDLTCQGLIYPRGAGAPPRLDRISFDLQAGECLAIIGDSGSGKTTLLHILSGIERCPIGSIFLDKTEVKTLGPETQKTCIGYLTQQAEMTKGTIAENICCFEAAPDDRNIIEAAKVAGVHGLISALPQSYQTDTHQNTALLSAGQKQRIALARAIYQNPKYLFLDEPNALLDALGERQLCDTLAALKSRGTTIIMVLHRSGIIGLADKVLLLDNGRLADFGTRSEVMSRMNDNKQRITLPLLPTSLLDLTDWIVAQFSRNSDKGFCTKAIMVATEMFNAACLNGPNTKKRQATFVFKFFDEKHCEIILKEEHLTLAADKMNKIRSLIKHPEVSMIDLPDDEIALAVVAQMSDALDVQNVENSSVFCAKLSSDNQASKGMVLQ